jgi:hypothetical protein
MTVSQDLRAPLGGYPCKKMTFKSKIHKYCAALAILSQIQSHSL